VKLRHLLVLLSAGLIGPGALAQLAPTVQPPPGALAPVEELAEEAQRQLFQSADQGPAGLGGITGGSRGGRKSATIATPKIDDPALWHKDSQHQLAVMDVAFGGATQTVIFELYPKDAPLTVANFIDNVESGSYKGLAFHRAVEGFLVQTGDPLTADEGARERWGTGGEAKTIPAEIKRPHRKGAVAMGRRSDAVNPSRRSNGYQFYFAVGNFTSLDGRYTVFGQVVSGMDVIERISKLPVDSNDCPIARVEIKSIKIIDHKGPLAPAPEDGNGRRASTKPYAAKGFFERMLERVW
jgi:cyclophilin family peptidyl-prolyl cis-trans isomerase